MRAKWSDVAQYTPQSLGGRMRGGLSNLNYLTTTNSIKAENILSFNDDLSRTSDK